MTQPVPEADHSLRANKSVLTDPELFELFQKVLEKWAFLPSASIGTVVDGPADLSLERLVRFSGPIDGTLVVRSSERFGLYLWENVSGGTQAAQSGAQADAFNEFVNLLCGHLLTSLRPLAKGTFKPYLPQTSNPSQWPQTQPQHALALLVEDIPVEVRLWLNDGSSQNNLTGGPRE